METIENRIERLEAELSTFEGRELVQDELDRRNLIINRLDEARHELRTQQQKEEKIEEKVQEDIAFSISGVDLSELPPEMIVVVEMIVKADRRKIYAEHALELEIIEDERDAYKADAELKISNQDAALEVLRQDYETCARELSEQQTETIRLVGERDDYKNKLANAAIQLSEKDAEIARLNDQINDYQKAKVFGEREAQNIIEINTDEANNINKAIAKVKESLEDKVNRGLARWAAELPEVVTPPFIDAPKEYPFQDTTATEPSDDQLPSAETVEVSQFPEAGHELAIPTSGDQAEVVSREEFEALRADVEALKRRQGMVA